MAKTGHIKKSRERFHTIKYTVKLMVLSPTGSRLACKVTFSQTKHTKVNKIKATAYD